MHSFMVLTLANKRDTCTNHSITELIYFTLTVSTSSIT